MRISDWSSDVCSSDLTAQSSVAVGTGAQATGLNTTAVGDNAVASGAHAVAIGNEATATADNSVALGNGSVADRANTVSVGAAGQERQIVRSEERGVGKECVRQFRSGGAPYH